MSEQRKKSYQIKWKKSAITATKTLQKNTRKAIIDTVEKIALNPLIGQKLQGKLREFRKVRVGDYRIIYYINNDEMVILIVRVGNRKDIYK